MAGSLTYRTYRGDNGIDYSIRIDESNASARDEASDSELCPARAGNYPAPPCGLKFRYVNTFDQARPVRKRRFIVGDTALIGNLIQPGALVLGVVYPVPGDAADGTETTWVVNSFRGEKNRIIPGIVSADTGLTDGDNIQ